jgi:MFS family permease
MKRKILFGIIGGLIGFMIGAFIGGYLGLVIGGTFLGSFDIYEQIGIEGYELSTYIGAIIGAIITTIWGVKLILKKISKKK